jgi:ribosome recycling factor
MEHELIVNAREEMDAVVEAVIGDLATVRTGRAKPDLLEHVMVEAYDTRMPIIELATISAPDAQLLVVQPWDESITEAIAKAIATSDLHLNPVVDGTAIRIAIPALTEERREEFVKLVAQKMESGRSLLRQARQDTKKLIEGLKGSPGVSEDDIFRLMDALEKLTDSYIEKIENLGKEKEVELRTV